MKSIRKPSFNLNNINPFKRRGLFTPVLMKSNNNIIINNNINQKRFKITAGAVFEQFLKTKFVDVYDKVVKVNNINIMDTFFSQKANQLCVSELSDRTYTNLTGNQAVTFLQGMVTSDIKRLLDRNIPINNQLPLGSELGVTNSQTSLFLNAKGRILFDTIIGCNIDKFNEEGIFIEHEQSKAGDFAYHLKSHILRKKVVAETYSNSFENNFGKNTIVKVFSVFGSSNELFIDNLSLNLLKHIKLIIRDPRHPLLGFRVYLSFEKRSQLKEFYQKLQENKLFIFDDKENNIYNRSRILLGIPENSMDLPPEHSLPLECNFGHMEAIHYDKGCYIGQELTTRTYHTGEVRKRICIVKSTSSGKFPNPGTDLSFIGPKSESILGKDRAGRMASNDSVVGLALVKYQPLLDTPNEEELALVPQDDNSNKLKVVLPYYVI
ncbi:hypothetical protein ABK040_006705 [Willaertia magna]